MYKILCFFLIVVMQTAYPMVYRSYGPNSHTLDTHMSQEDRQNTGVDKLTPQERKALQRWIDQHHDVKPGKTKHPEVSEVLSRGGYIRLSDGTMWKIYPADTPITLNVSCI
jgi:hypothetical protein